MADLSSARRVKDKDKDKDKHNKNDKDAGVMPPSLPSDTLAVKFTVVIEATTTSTTPRQLQQRLRYNFLSQTQTTTPALHTWTPAQPNTSAQQYTWTQDHTVNVDKPLLLQMEQQVCTFHIEHKPIISTDDVAALEASAASIKSPRSKPSAVTATSTKKKKDNAAADAMLNDDAGYKHVGIVSLPWSALLSAPYSCTISLPNPACTNTLPDELAAVNITIHTHGVNPIHTHLINQLLPLRVTLLSLSGLTSQPVSSFTEMHFRYRPLSLSFSIAEHPHTFHLPVTYTRAETIVFPPTCTPVYTVFLGHLSPAALYALSQKNGLTFSIHDRDHRAILTTAEEQQQRQEEQQRIRAIQLEKERLHQEQEAAAKKTPAANPANRRLNSPGRTHKREHTPIIISEADKPPTTDPAPSISKQRQQLLSALDRLKNVSYDHRSNVYAEAVGSLADVFKTSTTASFDVMAAAMPVFPPADVPLHPPQLRINPYVDTYLQCRCQLLHPLPSLSDLQASVPIVSITLVLPYASEAYSAVYEKIIQRNELACGVQPGHGGRGWIAQVKGTQTAAITETATTAVNTATSAASIITATAATGETPSSTASSQPPAARPRSVLAPSDVVLTPDHVTGVMITDGIHCWICMECLATGTTDTLTSADVLHSLVQQVQAQYEGIRCYYDPSLRSASRVYEQYPLSLHTIRVHTPIKTMLSTATIMHTPAFKTLSVLATLLNDATTTATTTTASSLSPSSLAALEQQCGTWVNDADMYGLQLIQQQQQQHDLQVQATHTQQQLFLAQEEAVQTSTEQYEKSIWEQIRKKTKQFILHANEELESVAAQYEDEEDEALISTQRRNGTTSTNTTTAAATAVCTTMPVFRYSNKAEYQQQLKALRQYCHSQSNAYYTYHLDYLHSSIPRYESMTEYEQEERMKTKQQWLTTNGFIASSSNLHKQLFSFLPLLSDTERQLERQYREEQQQQMMMKTQGQEEETKQQQLVEREKQFYNVPCFPSLFDNTPQRSVHLHGVAEMQAMKRQQELQRQRWAAKIVVKDASFHVLWRGQTHPSSGKAANAVRQKSRLRALEGLLKDPPQKKGLTKLPVVPAPVSITNVGPWSCPADQKYREEGKLDGQEEFMRYVGKHTFIHRLKTKAEKY